MLRELLLGSGVVLWRLRDYAKGALIGIRGCPMEAQGLC